MQRAFRSFVLLMTLLAGASRASHATSRLALQDTIVVRLPNQAVLTLLVRDAAQLRDLPKYHLDSLTARLASYIAQANSAAKTGSTDQVTLQFYPDKDQPGKNLPEQIRITAHKTVENTSRVDVVLNKAFGVAVSTDKDGGKSYRIGAGNSHAQREASRDSARQKKVERNHLSAHLIFDLGINALVNQKQYFTPSGQPEAVDLRTEGSRYASIGLNWQPRLGGKHSPLYLLVGPEFSFNNFMLSGNDRWVSNDTRTDVVRDTRQLQKTKLATSSINLPLLLSLKLRDSHYHTTFRLGMGGFVGYRLKSWTKLKYTTDGTTYKDKDDGNYHMENFLYGLQGTIGYRSLELFAKYNMNSLFKAGAGPDTQVLSFGLRLLK